MRHVWEDTLKHPFWNWFILIIASIALVAYLFISEGRENIAYIASVIDNKWLIVGCLQMVVYWTLDASVLLLLRRQFQPDATFPSSFRSSLVGMMFGNLTPLQTGNITSQILVLTRDGMESGDALTVMLTKNIISMIASVFLMVVSFLTNNELLRAAGNGMFGLVVTGIVLNVTLIVLLVIAGKAQGVLLRLTSACVDFLALVHIVRNPAEIMEKLKKQITRMHDGFRLLGGQKKRVLPGTGLALCAITICYSVSYAIYRSFGLHESPVVSIVAGQVFIATIQSFIPLPGGIVGADSGFYFILKSVFTDQYINFALILWRVLTFYLPILVGLAMLLAQKKKTGIGISTIVNDAVKNDVKDAV